MQLSFFVRILHCKLLAHCLSKMQLVLAVTQTMFEKYYEMEVQPGILDEIDEDVNLLTNILFSGSIESDNNQF